ncbi:MAG TPA: hypothetical protein EYM95_16050 [Candidatus Obscuribacterales bacterium]|nr:hypothetical protein [Candidatus Obscuribacterales bacterium]
MRKNNGLVPPPPPMVPSLVQAPAAIPVSYQSMAPQQAQPQQIPFLAPPMTPKMDVTLPQAPNLQSMAQGPSEQDLSQLRGLSDINQRFAQMKMDALQQNPEPFPRVNQLPQSDFDQYFQQRLQQQILQNMDSGNGVGERFGKGWDAGQQFASSIVIPAIGSFGSGNNAIGALQASQMLQEGIKGRQQQRAANKQAFNNSLVNLASLYENISPKSAKNISALMKMNMERQNANLNYQNRTSDDILKALQGSTDSTAKLIGIQQKGAELKIGAADKDFGNNMDITKEKRAQSTEESNQQKDKFGMQIDAAKLGLARDNAELDKEKFGEQKNQFGQTFAETQAKNRSDAASQFLSRMQQPMANSVKTQQFGGKAYPGILESYANDPALMQAFQALGSRAGISGSPFQTAQPGAMPQGAAPAAPQPFDPLGWLARGSQPAVPIEQVVKQPAQFVKLDQQQSQILANAKQNPQQAAAILAPAIAAQHPNATPEQIAQILNKLAGGK